MRSISGEVLFVAGESSGDLHAAGVAEAIRKLQPERALFGIGGNRMRAAGVELIEHVENLAVMGFVEVVRHVPHHWKLLRQLRERMQRGHTALVVLIDYAGFNMQVAKAARDAGVPVLYYVTPQVWASRAGRLPKLARVVTKAACILPFEEALLREHGIDATFVGHPLLDRALELPTQAEARSQLGMRMQGELLAVFPGSRKSELAFHLEPFVETARELQRRRPGLDVVVATAPSMQIDSTRCPFPQISGASFRVLRAATAGLLKSGTTTLEAAVVGLPHVIAYRTSGISYAIAKRVVTIPRIGLVNVVANREVSREFVQHALVPVDMANALEPLLTEGSAERAAAVQGLANVRAQLGTPGAAERVATMAIGMMS
ncbi:MAG: lipid-A-disaccharide synthase [Phycisphaerae bacterium]|nr:lipid-A-disaccharide synthase [Gemmatimonadaceae bacterium]